MRQIRLLVRRGEGQALIMVALALGVLITLIVGVNDIALRRRTQTRIQNSLDQAVGAAVAQLTPDSLVSGTPSLLPQAATERFHAVLKSGLARVATAIDPDPATVAKRAHVQVLAAGASCHGQIVDAPAVCADLQLTVLSVFGARPLTFTTLAQAASQR
jgi:hypothetical protein